MFSLSVCQRHRFLIMWSSALQSAYLGVKKNPYPEYFPPPFGRQLQRQKLMHGLFILCLMLILKFPPHSQTANCTITCNSYPFSCLMNRCIKYAVISTVKTQQCTSVAKISTNDPSLICSYLSTLQSLQNTYYEITTSLIMHDKNISQCCHSSCCSPSHSYYHYHH